jgi:predicted DNA-binding protein (MmcQ/YjbR family)
VNPLTIAPDRLERLRKLCLALPQAAEKEAWGDPTWRIAGHIFAMQKGNYAGGRPSVWLKAPPGEQPTMVEARPDRFFVPPYVGAKGWIGVWLDGRVDWAELSALVATSYLLLAPKRLAAGMTAAAPRRPRHRGRGPTRPQAPARSRPARGG